MAKPKPRTRTTKKQKTLVDRRIKTYMDAVRNDSTLLGPVDRHLKQVPNDRDHSVFHPSEMVDPEWCWRRTWHLLNGKVPTPDPIPLRLALIFEEGHAIHRKWQRWTREMGILWGEWQCILCEQTVLDYSAELPGSGCVDTASGTHQWKYKEVPLGDRSKRLGGRADGIVNPTGTEPVVMEVKSIGPGTLRKLDVLPEYHVGEELEAAAFSRVTRPLNTHFRQLQIYLRLAQKYTEILGPINRGILVYEQKADQQVREFPILYDPAWTDDIFEAMDDINWAMDKGREVKCPYGGCAKCKEFDA